MAFKYDITIEQGITFSKTFTRKVGDTPVDMTGMQAKAPIRTRDGLLLGEFICTVNGAAGEIVLGMDHLTTASLDFDTAIFDIDLWSGGNPIRRLMRGVVTLCKDVQDA